MRRLSALLILVIGMFALSRLSHYSDQSIESSTIALGFLIVSAYLMGQIVNNFGLPKVTGYILSGLIFGPFGLKFLSPGTISDLDFINHMALALIAFYAGGELKLSHLKENKRSMIFIAFTAQIGTDFFTDWHRYLR